MRCPVDLAQLPGARLLASHYYGRDFPARLKQYTDLIATSGPYFDNPEPNFFAYNDGSHRSSYSVLSRAFNAPLQIAEYLYDKEAYTGTQYTPLAFDL